MSKNTENLEEEIREQQEKLKGKPFKEKLSYFIYYYKWHVIVTLLCILLLSAMVSSILSRRDDAFYMVLTDVDHTMQDPALLQADFESFAGIDDRHKATFDTGITLSSDNALAAMDSYYGSERFEALIIAGQLDAVCTDIRSARGFSDEDSLVPLSDVIPSDILQTLEQNGLLLHADQGDSSSPVIGIRMDSSPVFESYGFYSEDRELYLVLLRNAPHKDMFLKFTAFIYPDLF